MEIKKILFLRPEHIGDYGMGLPALRAIRKKYPDAQIDAVVGPWNEGFAKATPYLNKVIVFDNPLLKRHLKYKDILKIIFSKDRKEIMDFNKKLSAENYDLLVSLSDRKFNKILLKSIKSKERIDGTEIRNTGFDERERLKQVMSKNGIEITDSEVELNYSEKDKSEVEKIIGNSNKQKKVIIHAITPLEEKNWPKENWRKIMKIFPDYKFYLIGSDKQKDELEELKKNISNAENLSGKLSIVQSIYLMKNCDLIIGSDSGPVHLAEITPIKIITLFGPTNVEMWGTPKEKGKVLKKENVGDIEVDEVKNAILELLK